MNAYSGIDMLGEADRLREAIWNMSFGNMRRKYGEPWIDVKKTVEWKLLKRFDSGERSEKLLEEMRACNNQNPWKK